MESDWVYCHFRQKKDSLNNFNVKMWGLKIYIN